MFICSLSDRQHAEFLLLLLMRWTQLSRVFGNAHFNNEIHCFLTLQMSPILTIAQELVSENTTKSSHPALFTKQSNLSVSRN